MQWLATHTQQVNVVYICPRHRCLTVAIYFGLPAGKPHSKNKCLARTDLQVHPKPLSPQYHFHPLSSHDHFHPKTSFIPKHFHPKPISSQNDFDVRTANKTTGWLQKQYCPCLCEGVAGRRPATPSHKHSLLMPTFGVSTGLHVEHRRPKAGDAPHEGLLKVERREFRCLGFRCLGV